MIKRAVCLSLRFVASSLVLILAGAAAVAQNASYSVIANLGAHPGEGSNPFSQVVFDQAGNLFGTTTNGGYYGHGTVYELIPKADGYWTEKTIANYHRYAQPSLLAIDGGGNVYGVTGAEGAYKHGTVYKLSPSADGKWTKTTIHTFHYPSAGYFPATGVVFDKEGNLYGATYGGGKYQGGTIFKLAPEEDGSWTESVIYSFQDRDYHDFGGITVDPAGNLDITAEIGGDCGGVALRLTRPKSEGASWTYATLHTFPGLPNGDDGGPAEDGTCHLSQLSLDAKGNLYGISLAGGGVDEAGTVFEISADGGVDGPDKILYRFRAEEGRAESPYGGVVFDQAGNLYGTATSGGRSNGGKIFELLPQTDGSWAMKALYNFGGRTYQGVVGADGSSPSAGMAIGPDGNLYGTTAYGGYIPNQSEGGGTVFKKVLAHSTDRPKDNP